ncbi:hypothetical protein [Clostridium sp. Marseille-QA1073]
MINSISKVVSIIIAVILMVMITYNMFWIIDRMVYNQVNVINNRFQKEVRTRGYIDREMYDNFMRELTNTGRIYDVEMLHRNIKYYPLSEDLKEYTIEKPYSIEYFKHNENEILNEIYNKDKRYLMRIGDDFTVTVRDQGTRGSRVLWNVIGGTKENNTLIFSTYGGMVENEIN